MKMGKGVCAHCGTRLTKVCEGTVWDAPLDVYAAPPDPIDDAPGKNSNRPYFCVDCYENVVDDDSRKDYRKKLAELESDMESAFSREYSESTSKRWYAFTAISENQYVWDQRPERYKTYFARYAREMALIRSDERAEQAVKQKVVAERQAEKDLATYEKQQEKAAVAREKLRMMDLAEAEKRRLELEKFQEPVTDIPFSVRFEHTHILAPSGTGKTTMIQEICLRDLDLADPPAMVVIDPKGEMVKRLKKLDVFRVKQGRLSDRLIILDATDVHHPPALNMFATAKTKDEATRRRIQNQTIDLFEYIFSSSEFKLTPKQSIGFSFLARLMFEIPKADIHKFLDVVEEEVDIKKGGKSIYAPYIAKLDDGAQRFFAKDFFGEFNETKSQVKARLYMILKSPELSAIFNAKVCAIDWFACLQQRKIILVNTGMNQLGEGASQLFGRYVIASVVAAAAAREVIPDRNQWVPSFLHIDEAQLFVDDTKTQRMLNLSREYNLGITLAHQQMTGHPLTDNIRNSISTNTSVKYAASVEGQDLGNAARDLHCEPEFIRKHQRKDGRVHFATYIRNMSLKGAFTTSAEIGNVEKRPQMPNEYLSSQYIWNMIITTGRLEPKTEEPAVKDNSLVGDDEPAKQVAAQKPPASPKVSVPSKAAPQKKLDNDDWA